MSLKRVNPSEQIGIGLGTGRGGPGCQLMKNPESALHVQLMQCFFSPSQPSPDAYRLQICSYLRKNWTSDPILKKNKKQCTSGASLNPRYEVSTSTPMQREPPCLPFFRCTDMHRCLSPILPARSQGGPIRGPGSLTRCARRRKFPNTPKPPQCGHRWHTWSVWDVK